MRIERPTVVIARNVTIARGASIDITQGASLSIVATDSLQILAGVKILSRGVNGQPGANGSKLDWPSPHDAYWEAKRSGCRAGKIGPGEENFPIVGKRGGAGQAGQTVRLIFSNGEIDPTFRIENDGGSGGPPGRSVGLHCYCKEHGNGTGNENGGIFDGDPPANEGEGPAGPPGKVVAVLFGRGAALASMRLRAAISQQSAYDPLDLHVGLRTRFTAAANAAIAEAEAGHFDVLP